MTLTPAVFREAIGKLFDDLRVFLDSTDNIIFATALVDGDGNHLIPSLTAPATDLEGLGDITVNNTETEIVISGTPREIRIQADEDNTELIYIGKTGVLSDGSNDYIRLNAGEEHTFQFNDTLNALFAICASGGQTINAGALLL